MLTFTTHFFHLMLALSSLTFNFVIKNGTNKSVTFLSLQCLVFFTLMFYK